MGGEVVGPDGEPHAGATRIDILRTRNQRIETPHLPTVRTRQAACATR
jgi:hypothetical protein